jgi:hypothetical protein
MSARVPIVEADKQAAAERAKRAAQKKEKALRGEREAAREAAQRVDPSEAEALR